MLETLNWLALTVPFILAGTAYGALQAKGGPTLLAPIAAFGILAAVFAGYALAYPVLGFPLWMRWFAGA